MVKMFVESLYEIQTEQDAAELEGGAGGGAKNAAGGVAYVKVVRAICNTTGWARRTTRGSTARPR